MDEWQWKLVLHHDTSPREIQTAFKVNLSMAIACMQEAREMGAADAMIKWPNDVWIRGKKIAGFIVDNSIVDKSMTCLVGVGMNINEDMSLNPNEFVRENATSLQMEVGKPLSRFAVLAGICNKFEKLLQMDMSDIRCLYKESNLLMHRRIIVKPKRREDPEGYEADVVGMSEEGFLVVQTLDGAVKQIAGEEVMVRLADGKVI